MGSVTAVVKTENRRNTYGSHGKNAKLRPCLCCDKPFRGTTDNRICSGCKSGTFLEVLGGYDIVPLPTAKTGEAFV